MPVELDQYCTDATTAGAFENQVLYSMCRNSSSSDHSSSYVTSGKVLAIGRIYAASPERGAGQMKSDGMPLSQAIGDKLKVSKLDKYLGEIGPLHRIDDEDTLTKVVKLHSYLVDAVVSATCLWTSNKKPRNSKLRKHPSFASKYLHFHRPNAFPIMDSFAKAGLKCSGSKGNIDEYGQFCRAFLLNATEQGELWTPRSIDTELVRRGRIHKNTEAEQNCKECGQKSRKRKKSEAQDVSDSKAV